MRDAIPRVRELQAEWQQHARTLPLSRAAEGALWARFKAATDAVFAQREAAFSAREAELAANLAAREALLARLSALSDDAPVAEIQRTLAEVDRAWRQDTELPRGAAGALEARYREGREAALAAPGRRRAESSGRPQCDTLAAKLALCEEREAGSAAEARSRRALGRPRRTAAGLGPGAGAALVAARPRRGRLPRPRSTICCCSSRRRWSCLPPPSGSPRGAN